MKGTKVVLLLLLSFVLTAAAPSFAQQVSRGALYDNDTGFENPPGRGNAQTEEKRQEIRKKIQAVWIWRLTEALKLDAATSAKLASIIGSFDRQRNDIMRDRRESMRELGLSLKSAKSDEVKLRSLLEKIEKNHQAMQGLREKEWKAMQDILTVRQQARFLVFQQQFGREMRNIIANARGGAGRSPMGGGPEKGSGPGMSSSGMPPNR